MAGEIVEDAKENKENQVRNDDQNKDQENQNDLQVERKYESRRKSSSIDSKLAPGDHTMVKRMDGTWRMFAFLLWPFLDMMKNDLCHSEGILNIFHFL